MVTYIHYGNDKYSPDLVLRTYNSVLKSKPDKGLWASRIDADYGWKSWCIDNDYALGGLDVNFKFTLSDNAKILEIHKEKDILPYVIKNCDVCFRLKGFDTDICDYINRDKLYREYDGIEVFFSENYIEFHSNIFNSWDCDSICV